MNFYIRLLSYAEACSIVEYINNQDLGYACIDVGGVSVTCSGYIDKDFIKDELHRNYKRFEITQDHPEEVKKRIVKELGLKNDSNK